MTAPTISVTPLVEQGFLVRGTLDQYEALRAVLALDTDEVHDMLAAPGGDEPDRDWSMRLGDLVHSLLADATAGHWRLVASDELDGDYEYRQAEGPGCGTFEGVLIR